MRELSTLQQEPSIAQPKIRYRGHLVIVALFALLLPFANPRVYATDEVQYYVYLRSLRFDGDLDFANDYQAFAQHNPKAGIAESLLQPNRLRPTGRYGNIAPVGAPIMWAPFFLLADGLVQLANLLGAELAADGFSPPYIYAVCYASALYGLLGLLLSYQLTRRFTTSSSATAATITIWFATPLVFYMFIQMPFAHATGFFLVALFITIWHQTRDTAGKDRGITQRSLRAWIALGVVGGLMTMVREQLGAFLLIPAIEALIDYRRVLRLREGLLSAIGALFVRHILFLCVFLIVLTPQLLTYYVLNGAPRPAGEVSNKLNPCSPHMIDTLIDYDPRPSAWCRVADDFTAQFPPFSRGAFVWSPVLVPAILGLALLWRRDRLLTIVLALSFLAQTYINGAFGTTWHLRGAFGFRRLIDSTPIFVIGLGLLLDWAAARIDRRWLLVPAILLIMWNAGLVLNATAFNRKTNLREGMTWPQLWQWQAELPGELASTFRDLLFNRCRFMENGCAD